jgi:hypothetical protein
VKFLSKFIRAAKMIYYRKAVVPAKALRWSLRATFLYGRTLLRKECYYGPFTGEFGHLLGHNLPFIAHLYSKGVRIHFCGLEIQKPFFVDEKGNEIVATYASVRDFFKEAAPDCNRADEPADVVDLIKEFKKQAEHSPYPYWNNDDPEYYFFFFRWWVNRKGYSKAFDLSSVYKTKEERSVVIFPRKWNSNFPDKIKDQLRNNGEVWDYYQVAKTVAPYFEKVYVLGHPVFSGVDFSSFGNVEVHLTSDNRFILEKCSNSRLIISQHSGTVYLGEYTDCQVLIIYKGGRTIGDIEITKTFKKGLGEKYPFEYAYSLDEIENFAKKYETVRN